MTAATVYIVDDDDDVRRAIAFLLKTAQYSVQTFSSGQAFLESSPNSFPACLLSDIRMAGMNGFELQREVMKRFRGLPIIFMTGHGDDSIRMLAMQEGAVDLLEKPFDDERLLDSIRRSIQKNIAQSGANS